MLVIIHSWSDTHASIRKLGKSFVHEGIIDQVRHVRLANHASLDDDVIYRDSVEALRKAWVKERSRRTLAVSMSWCTARACL